MIMDKTRKIYAYEYLDEPDAEGRRRLALRRVDGRTTQTITVFAKPEELFANIMAHGHLVVSENFISASRRAARTEAMVDLGIERDHER